MDGTISSRTRVLNYGLASFLIALSMLILVYKWVV
jgi:hypothetical protein